MCVLLAPSIFNWFDHDATVRPWKSAILQSCAGALPLLISTTLACFYSGRGHTTVIMVNNLIATLINAAASTTC